ncbi:hypothetical protein JAAARDRAFT_36249 [Jaapia argillacea MUCL 33604]|uniref:Uncharacterized protein n=1 Tax=Jaapia argillacea MUCL 33604 TaxID=933084 RepID=A0A067PSF1_9AGAM|nr:hypothetical protein JAAARDRAFT_36249 [Jaapia argillacea MUCL 33604]
MSSKQSPGYNGAPKYINDFSKALANEVRILLEEVGKLRDERRALQHEISELMSLKSKHGAGGEYSADWMPKKGKGEEPPPPPPTEPPAMEDIAPAKPGWRTVAQKPAKGQRRKGGSSQAMVPLAPEPTKPNNMPAWAQWRPSTALAPQPQSAPPPQQPSPAPRAGLFGPPSPPPK